VSLSRHVLGGLNKLADAPVVIIAEGYDNAATIKEAIGLPAVVAAFDSGNLKEVAKALHENILRNLLS
jgi:putative DNA primase/helicase